MKQMIKTIVFWIGVGLALPLAGCGYSNSFLHRDDVQTVYVEMFNTDSFRRGHEYTLTDAICKHIEARTPYKIVSDRNVADTVLSGQLSIGNSVLAMDRYTGQPLERETLVTVVVTWKNSKTGELMVNNQPVYGSGTYASQLGQSYDYSIEAAVNRAAVKVVELMEKPF